MGLFWTEYDHQCITTRLRSTSACKRLMFGFWPLTRPPPSFSAILRLSASGLMKVEAVLHFSATEFTQSNLHKAGTRRLTLGALERTLHQSGAPPGTGKVLYIRVLN